MNPATSHSAARAPTDECVLDVTGMDCASCVAHVTKAARTLPGVRAANVNLARGRAVVEFDPAAVRPDQIAAAITGAGYPATPQARDQDGGEAEQHRIAHQRQHARQWFGRAVAGVVLWLPVELTHWALSLAGVHAHHGPTWMDYVALVTATVAILFIGGAFYRSAWRAARRGTSNMDTLIALGASVAYGYSLVALIGAVANHWPLPPLYFMEATGLLALISLGHYLEARARDQAGSAIRDLLNLAPAVALRLKKSDGEVGSGGDGEQDHSDSSPPPPHLPTSPSLPAYDEVPVSQLHEDDHLLIRPGDRIPVDGVVVAGKSDVDESMITGEPLPAVRAPGDEVIAGTLNQTGRLTVRATKVGAETALAQIVRLVETAQNSKPPVQRLADRVAAVFVPSVLSIALLTGLGWYAYAAHHHWPAGQAWAAIAKAVCSVLIIACPCALGLAVPAALMVGTGRGAKRGILIRDIDALQSAERITTVVLDKTGTITAGRPVVADVIPANQTALAASALLRSRPAARARAGFAPPSDDPRPSGAGGTSPADELLRLAASAEQFSEHPLAKAIVNAARARELRPTDPDSFDYEPGYGVVAGVEGATLLVGNLALLQKHGIDAAVPEAAGHRSVVLVARKNAAGHGRYLGALLIDDQVKPDSKAAIAELHRMGIKTVLLTGDNERAARAVADEVGIDDVLAEVRPHEKAAVVRALRSRARVAHDRELDEILARARAGGTDVDLDVGGPPPHERVAMVGDGVNDAPALAAADLGVAIGSGSDVAKETGGIVLVSGSLAGIATALRLSRATMTKVRQNLFLAFVYNVLAIPLAALGVLTPLVAAGAMALSDVTVIGNALLLRRTRIE